MNRFKWPDGKRCTVVLSFDVDGEAGVLGLGGDVARRPSVLSQASYGPRVGVPRILELLKRYGLVASFYIPGYEVELYPGMVEAVLKEGHEIGHHGYLHEKINGMSPREEEEVLLRGIEALVKITGSPPKGYRAPWWEINEGTPALLLKHGFQYDSSLMGDDIPYYVEAGGASLLEIPISWLLDDWEQYAYSAEPHWGYVIETPEKAFQLWAAEFDGMYDYGSAFVLTMHPELTGRASRVKNLERLVQHMLRFQGVWFTTCGGIADYCRASGLGG